MSKESQCQWESINRERFAVTSKTSDSSFSEFEGIYQGSYLEKRSSGESCLLHYVSNEDYGEIAIWGCGALDASLTSLNDDTPIRIKYKGQRILADGRKFNAIDVQVPRGTLKRNEDNPNIKNQYDPDQEQQDLPL